MARRTFEERLRSNLPWLQQRRPQFSKGVLPASAVRESAESSDPIAVPVEPPSVTTPVEELTVAPVDEPEVATLPIEEAITDKPIEEAVAVPEEPAAQALPEEGDMDPPVADDEGIAPVIKEEPAPPMFDDFMSYTVLDPTPTRQAPKRVGQRFDDSVDRLSEKVVEKVNQTYSVVEPKLASFSQRLNLLAENIDQKAARAGQVWSSVKDTWARASAEVSARVPDINDRARLLAVGLGAGSIIWIAQVALAPALCTFGIGLMAPFLIAGMWGAVASGIQEDLKQAKLPVEERSEISESSKITKGVFWGVIGASLPFGPVGLAIGAVCAVAGVGAIKEVSSLLERAHNYIRPKVSQPKQLSL